MNTAASKGARLLVDPLSAALLSAALLSALPAGGLPLGLCSTGKVWKVGRRL